MCLKEKNNVFCIFKEYCFRNEKDEKKFSNSKRILAASMILKGLLNFKKKNILYKSLVFPEILK